MTLRPPSPPARRVALAAIALLYSLLMVVSHDQAQTIVRSVQQDPAWTWGALATGIALLGGLAWTAVGRVASRAAPASERRRLSVAWAIVAAYVAVCHWLLMSVHTEAVHFIQYGLLAGILLPSVRSVPLTMAVTVLIGIADESYQYWCLYADWPVYLDINDIVLNAVAAMILFVYLRTAIPGSIMPSEDRPMFRHADTLGLVLLALVLLAGTASGTVALHPSSAGPNTLLLLNRADPSGSIWFHAWWSGKDYLALSPLHGLAALGFVGLGSRLLLRYLRTGGR